ncbi:MAG: sigma-70 family RNA polymerase sigma factor [Planctomycetota bacterium]
MSEETKIGNKEVYFKETQWTNILRVKNKSSLGYNETLNQFISIYWKPIYFYIRRSGKDIETAKDLTQEFFTVFLEKDFIKDVERSKGRFRSFMLAALQHFLSKQRERESTQKRGGGKIAFSLEDLISDDTKFDIQDKTQATPEKIFIQEWALTILHNALENLHQEYQAQSRARYFDVLKSYLSASMGKDQKVTYTDIAKKLGISENDVTNYLHRARRRYREFIEDEIKKYVADEIELKEELKVLFSAFSDNP